MRKWEKPTMYIVNFDRQDVITTSGDVPPSPSSTVLKEQAVDVGGWFIVGEGD